MRSRTWPEREAMVRLARPYTVCHQQAIVAWRSGLLTRKLFHRLFQRGKARSVVFTLRLLTGSLLLEPIARWTVS